jgi:hypothetical protein
MPPAPVRRPSASANHSSSTPSSSARHRIAESHGAFATMATQAPSIYSSNPSSASANHQQQIIRTLVDRLKNKVFFPSHLSLLASLIDCSYPLIQAWI